MYCPKCGEQTQGRYCPICGHPVNDRDPTGKKSGRSGLFRMVLILIVTVVVVALLLALAAKNLNGPFILKPV